MLFLTAFVILYLPFITCCYSLSTVEKTNLHLYVDYNSLVLMVSLCNFQQLLYPTRVLPNDNL